jgi:hypothetical protein
MRANYREPRRRNSSLFGSRRGQLVQDAPCRDAERRIVRAQNDTLMVFRP